MANGVASIDRSRLLSLLDSAPRLVVIRAPAGFGKSTLLDQWHRRLAAGAHSTLRINLTPRTSSPAGFLGCLGDALGEPGCAELDRVLTLLGSTPDPPLTVLIDNADLLRNMPATGALVLELLVESPRVRIALVGRGDFGMSLARLTLTGGLMELGPQQLRFDASEVQAFVDLNAVPSSSRTIEELSQKVLGWPLGCGLRVLSTRHLRDTNANTPITGSWKSLGAYFEQEGFNALAPELQSFLEEISILEVLNVRACDALRDRSDSAGLLEQAYQIGVHLWPTDPQHESFEMLPLFVDFLRMRLDSTRTRELQTRAVTVLQGLGHFRGACTQALALGDHERAASLLEQYYVANLAPNDTTQFMPLAEALDSGVRDRHLLVLLAMAQALIFNFRCDVARLHLNRAALLFADRAHRPLHNAGLDEQSLQILLMHAEMLLALGLHDMSAVQLSCDKLLQNMEKVPPVLRVMILHSLLQAQLEFYIFRGVDRFYAQAKRELSTLDSWLSSLPLETDYARYLFQTGRTPAAVDLLEKTLARLISETGPRPVLGSIAGIALAEMKLERGEYAEAMRLVADFRELSERFGFLSLIIVGRIVQCRLHMVMGEVEKGFEALENPPMLSGELYDRLSHVLAIERIYWLLRHGSEQAARQACHSIGMSLAKFPEPGLRAGPAEEAFALAWIQLARTQNRRLYDAIQVARKWQRYTEGVGAIRCNVRWNVQLSILLTLQGDRTQSMRALRRAISAGTAGQYRQAFSCDLDVIGPQLTLLLESNLSETEANFVASIFPHSGAVTRPRGSSDASRKQVGTLTSRETAIANLVVRGMVNREIGDALGMTEGTVKWHLHRIYEKLDIRRRSQIAVLMSN